MADDDKAPLWAWIARLLGLVDTLQGAAARDPQLMDATQRGMLQNPAQDDGRPHLPPYRLPQRGDIALPPEARPIVSNQYAPQIQGTRGSK